MDRGLSFPSSQIAQSIERDRVWGKGRESVHYEEGQTRLLGWLECVRLGEGVRAANNEATPFISCRVWDYERLAEERG